VHARQKGQLIEEAEDFNRAAGAVKGWVDANGGWERTLLIITSDHGNGLVLGPDAEAKAFQAVENRGKGVMPGMSFQAAGHTNELVRLWAKGAYAPMFYRYAADCDDGFSVHTGHNSDGAYIDNTDIFKVMSAAVEGR
jgi:alkaline phosphatase